jgi:hypothetical protein
MIDPTLLALEMTLNELNVEEMQRDTQQEVAGYAKKGVTPKTLHEFRKLYFALCKSKNLPLAPFVQYPEELRDIFINQIANDYTPKHSIFEINELEEYKERGVLNEKQYEQVVDHWIKKGIRGFINEW